MNRQALTPWETEVLARMIGAYLPAAAPVVHGWTVDLAFTLLDHELLRRARDNARRFRLL